MSDKQFIVEQLEILNDENEWKGEYWWAVVNTQRVEDCFECRNKEVALKLCDFLNKSSDDFKWQIRQCEKWSAIVKQLKKENEQLHLAIEDLLTHTSCEKVKKENSDLRQNITIIKDLLSECDLFSDKATKHDIIAYKEMRQFDNKDAYCICTAIKKAIEKLKRCNDE